jgi:DNA recombination-dependent growth factor C
MGAFSGSLTYRQYSVRDALPEGHMPLFQDGIERNVFHPLDPSKDQDRALGWCNPRFAMDLDLDSETYVYTDYIVLAMRVDAWAIPATTLKLYTEAEVQRVMAEQKRESLSRYEHAEAKERVMMELRRRILPTIKVIDMVWNLDQGVVRFFNSSQRMNVDFMDLFESTFGLVLMPYGAFAAAHSQHAGLIEAERERLEVVDPSVFVDDYVATQAMREV